VNIEGGVARKATPSFFREDAHMTITTGRVMTTSNIHRDCELRDLIEQVEIASEQLGRIRFYIGDDDYDDNKEAVHNADAALWAVAAYLLRLRD
jgi:hypothetical protein